MATSRLDYCDLNRKTCPIIYRPTKPADHLGNIHPRNTITARPSVLVTRHMSRDIDDAEESAALCWEERERVRIRLNGVRNPNDFPRSTSGQLRRVGEWKQAGFAARPSDEPPLHMNETPYFVSTTPTWSKAISTTTPIANYIHRRSSVLPWTRRRYRPVDSPTASCDRSPSARRLRPS